MKFTISILLVLVSGLGLIAAPEAMILRYPDIHKDKVAFVFTGDIYIASSAGGPARRLTSHIGRELFPKFSPDGKWIAFSGEYNGTRQVYVISSEGGRPKQLTYYNDVGPMPPRGGFDYQVLDWTPDGKSVLFRGNRLPWGVRMGKYFTVPVAGGSETALEIPEAGGGMFSPDGTKVVYTPIGREYRTWKRYRGGRAQDVWIYDLVNHSSRQLTDHPMTDNQPLWIGNKIYFTSDRDYTLNLFSVDPANPGVPAKVTNHDKFDVLWPSAGPDQIVYENGGRLRVYTPASGEDKAIAIQIVGDFTETLAQWKNVKQFINTSGISPSGARAVFEARGDIYTVPAKNGEIRNITQSQGVRERDATWSPDGKWIAYHSDRTGEYELTIRAQDGSGTERALTKGSKTWYYTPVWSPDSKSIAMADRTRRLLIVDVASGAMTEVDKSIYRSLTEFTWSSDSQWIAYTNTSPNQYSSIWAYSLKDKTRAQLTSDYTNTYEPVFSPDGKYLYFLSDRDFNMTFSGFEFKFVYTNPTRVYAATLNPTVDAPLAPESDEEKGSASEEKGQDQATKKSEKDGKNNDKSGKEGESTKAVTASLVLAGFESRIFALPPGSGNYFGLSATAKGPLYLSGSNSGPPALKLFDMSDKKELDVLGEISGYQVAAKGEKLLYRQGSNFGIVAVGADQKKANLNLDSLEMKIDPLLEWPQIYQDGRRMLRDWFYDPNMHGYDFEALTAKYEEMVPHIKSRADLDFLLAELGSELSSGHYYVNSGDEPTVDRNNGGLLGADIVADASGYYRIARILPGENWDNAFRSPLRDLGVKVNEGDFILAVDGAEIRTETNFYSSLEGKGNQVVTLTVNDKPSREGAHDERVRTITSESGLFYLDWVNSRREMVNRLSGGRIGYIHLPDTAVSGNRELYKHFYAQMDKDALILDARYNGGGFIPDSMIALLERPVLSHWSQRGIEPFRTPGVANAGPKACLINGYSSSGGDAFPYYFRKRGLGKIFGTRTWGGLIGLQGNPGFADGGSISVPVFRIFDENGNWIVENEGVAPDVEVIDRPELVAKGQDPTLETAVAHLLEELAKNPPKPVKVPQPPDESKIRTP